MQGRWLHRVLVFIAASRLAFSQSVCPDTDPCRSGNWQDRTEPHRDWTVVDGTDQHCDNDMSAGWYRFLHADGWKISVPVTDCVREQSCGASSQIFINKTSGENPLPTDGIVIRQACVSLHIGGFPTICCVDDWSVCVRHCGDEGLLYYLRPPRGCNQAYCTDSRPVACKKGQQLVDGICVDRFPAMASQPLITVNYDLSYRSSEIIFQCHLPLLDVADNAKHLGVNFKVAWFRDGRQVKKLALDALARDKQVTVNSPIKDLFRKSETVALGFDIYCEVRVAYSEGKSPSPWTQSNVFYAGIQARPEVLRVSEGHPLSNPKQITVYSTVPIVCGQNETDPRKTCGLDLDSRLGTFVDQTDVLTDWCSVAIEGGTNVSQPLGVSAVRDGVDDGVREHDVIISTKRVVSRTPLEWVGHPPLRVKVLTESVPSADCYTATYGHYKTFDGWSFDFASRGEFTLVQSSESNLRIHSRVWPCSTGSKDLSCTCGVAILEDVDLVVVDMCQWQDKDRTRITALPVRITKRSEGTLGEGVKVFSNAAGTEYKIETLSGVNIKIFLAPLGLNVFIRVPEDEFNATSGLCGNNNANSKDDSQEPDRTVHTSIDDFGSSWRIVRSQDSLFTRLVKSSHSSREDALHCQCTGHNNTVTASSSCSGHLIQQPKQLRADGYWSDISDQIESVSDLSGLPPYSADVTDVYDFKVVSLVAMATNFPTASGITELVAESRCRDVLSNSNVARECHVTSAEMDEIVRMCVDDVKSSDSLEQAHTLLPLLMQSCEMSVFSNFSLWSQSLNLSPTLSAALQPPMFARASLCSSDCSGHGDCVESVCVCESGYTSSDCSSRVGAAPQLFDFANDGLCDLNVESCSDVVLLGDRFVNSEMLQCMFYDGPDDRQATRTWGLFESQREVSCELRPPDKIEAINAIDIRVTVDGRRASERITYIRYDSSCVECSKPGDCPIKSGTCVIDNRCFVENEISETSWCDQCRPDVNQTVWSPRADNSPPQFTSKPRNPMLIPGDTIALQLQARDPERKIVTYHVQPSSQPGMSLSRFGSWRWAVPLDTEIQSYTLTFYAIDQCGLKSEPLSLLVTVQSCPCQNSGRCGNHPDHAIGSGRYTCDCVDGYVGPYCGTNVDECASKPCLYGGQCIDMVNSYTCDCQLGYTGRLCESNINDCLSKPCRNGGTCVDDIGSFRCLCLSGYTGHTCEIDVNECTSSPCANGGVCVDDVNSFQCECAQGYSGYLCDSLIDNCLSSPCANGGTCHNGVARFACSCAIGYTGEQCTGDVDYCASQPCFGGVACTDLRDTFECGSCPQGFFGDGISCDEVQRPNITTTSSSGNLVIGRDLTTGPGSTILIDCITTGAPEPTIQWTKNGRTSRNSRRVTLFQNGTLRITGASVQDSGKYACRASNEGGSAERSSVVTVGTKPTIALRPRVNRPPTTPNVIEFVGHPVAMLTGMTLRIYCLVTGSPRPTISWKKDEEVLVLRRGRVQALRDGSLVIRPVVEGDSGEYTCVGFNSVGAAERSSTLDVFVPPSILNDIPDGMNNNLSADQMLLIGLNTTLVVGQSLALACPITGNPSPQLNWYKDTKSTNMAKMVFNDTTLMIQNASLVDSGVYRCLAKNTVGQDMKDSAVAVTGTLKLVVSPRGRVVVFSGQSTEITCSSFGYNTTAVQWLHEPRGTQVAVSDKLKLTSTSEGLKLSISSPDPGDSQMFSCAARNHKGELIKEAITFVVFDPQQPVINRTSSTGNHVVGQGDLFRNPGSTVLIDCIATGAPVPTIQWTKYGRILRSSRRVTMFQNGTLRITGASVSDSGKYACTASNAGGSVERNSIVTVGVKPVIPLGRRINQSPFNPHVTEYVGHPVAIRTGGILQIYCIATGTPKPTIKWKKQGEPLVSNRRVTFLRQGSLVIRPVIESDSGLYTCVASNGVGRYEMSSTVDVLVPPQLINELPDRPGVDDSSDRNVAIGLNASLTVGQSISLFCIASGNPTPQLTWYRGEQMENMTMMPWNDTELVIRNVSVSDAGVYRCSAANGVGQVSQNSVLTITEPVRLNVTPKGRIVALSGQTVEVTCSAVGYPLPTVQWKSEPSESPIAVSNKLKLASTNRGLQLIVKNVVSEDSQTFSCNARDHTGRMIKENVTLVVFDRNCSADAYFWNRTYETGMQYAAVVFLVKESAQTTPAMRDWLPGTALRIDEELLQRGIGVNKPNQFAVVGFGGKGGMRRIKVEDQMLYPATSVSDAAKLLKEDPSKPDGYFGIIRALKDLPFAKNREFVVSLFLVTDQVRFISRAGRKMTRDRIDRVLSNRSIIFSSLLNLDYHFSVDVRGSNSFGYDALLVDYSGLALVAAKDGKFFPRHYKNHQPRVHIDRQMCEMFSDYGELALKHHGFVGDFAAAVKKNMMDVSLMNAVATTMANSVLTFNVCEKCRCEDLEEGTRYREPTCSRPRNSYWCWCKFRGEEDDCHKVARADRKRDMAAKFNSTSMLPDTCFQWVEPLNEPST